MVKDTRSVDDLSTFWVGKKKHCFFLGGKFINLLEVYIAQFTYIWLIYMVKVGRYIICGCYGVGNLFFSFGMFTMGVKPTIKIIENSPKFWMID